MVKEKTIYYCNKLLHIVLMCFLCFSPKIFLYGININIDNDKNQNVTINETQNKIPVVNINKPDSNGVSHNYFKDYNVGKNGIIINNGKGVNTSELGGSINGNPNLQNSKEAQKIITEVTGTNISKIEGFTEIVGKSADYILANPNGVYINKAGFINTPNVMITTGKPKYINNEFSVIDVEKGDVIVGENGVDARNITKFDIISRTARLNGKIYGGKEVNVILGKNQYNVSDGTITSTGGTGTGLALDANELGSIYAGKIYLYSSDAGVGVNSKGAMLADSNDLTIDVNGDLALKNISGKTGVNIVSNNFVSNGQILSEKTVKVKSKSLKITDESVVKGNKVTIESGIIENHGGILGHEEINLIGELPKSDENISDNEILAQDKSFTNHGKLISKNIIISSGNFENYGDLVGTEVSIVANNSLKNLGDILSDNIDIRGYYLENTGSIYSNDSFKLDFNSIVNLENIISKNKGTLSFQYLKNGENAILYTFNDLIYKASNTSVYTENFGIFGYGNRHYINRDGVITENTNLVDGTFDYNIGASYFSNEEISTMGVEYNQHAVSYNDYILTIEENAVVLPNTEVPDFTYIRYVDDTEEKNDDENNNLGKEDSYYLEIYKRMENENLLGFDFYKNLNEIKMNKKDKTYENTLLYENNEEEDEIVEDDEESWLIRELLRNGKEVAASLGLVRGEPLTEEQISNLLKDIIWFERTIENGIEILQAKIYLSGNTIDKIATREGKLKFATLIDKLANEIDEINNLNNKNLTRIRSQSNEDIVSEISTSNDPTKENKHQNLENKGYVVEVIDENNSLKVIVKENIYQENTKNIISKANVDFLKIKTESVPKSERKNILDGTTIDGIIKTLSSLSEEN
ncbi:filamentous hemagglutinin N-terminal domain-containing protein [Fusobacterium sp. PH5-44]|uniref:filamentous hemagglutinin N-terminal domain-containing protein n=1 Tax=unclassified Fusobacterium TaxID=2648384 RepID=UPI003D1E6AE1